MGTVLIVDDEYVVADILGFALEDEGYTVLKASNARKGLDILERDRPSLVITDFMMPGMNGAEFARAIRAKSAFAHIPIILMTGAQGREGRSAPELFTRVYDKPFDMDIMIAAVADLIPHGDETP
ncbi:response regulator [Pseudomonas sp. dw_358]|uniref:response regulator n=1 Tax=Pseudomonas sp. dw_358 TaxID=2720083 RepID=UPI001BD4AF17|nr:response regulator [Pseudomonas sp. dw_358]